MTKSNAIGISTYLFMLAAVGCLDLELLDDMEPFDTEQETGNDFGGEAGGPENGPGMPATNPSDSTPPSIIGLACASEEDTVEGFCVASGPAGISLRFETDEPATVALEGPAGWESRVFSEAWDAAHHGGLFGPSGMEATATVTARDVNGNEAGVEIPIRTADGVPIAITEILADPLGAEPDQEFVEIVNLGEAAADLSGWMIDDNGDADGDLIPPGMLLAPGQTAVITSPDYDPGAPGETPLAANALHIVLDGSIASNGLKNSEAETIELYDADAALVSTYRGGAGPPSEGISAVRIAAGLPDDDPLAFASHPTGASPGVADDFD